MDMDKKFINYILWKCVVDINILSKQTNINYQFLYQSLHGDRKLKDSELDILMMYIKKNTTLSDTYIHKRINKIKNRNQSKK